MSNDSLWKAKQTLEENKIERALIVDNGELVGLVTKTQLYTELGKYTDLLTGLYTSDYIYHQSAQLIENGMEISIIFIDLNKFGAIDKEYGHAQGDVILRELGMLLKNHLPDGTYLCRFGGDEFVVLTPYNFEKCKLLADNLLNAISCHIFCNSINVTASAGIAGGRRNDARACISIDNVSELINLASLASTRAKREKMNLAVAEGFCVSETA